MKCRVNKCISLVLNKSTSCWIDIYQYSTLLFVKYVSKLILLNYKTEIVLKNLNG